MPVHPCALGSSYRALQPFNRYGAEGHQGFGPTFWVFRSKQTKGIYQIHLCFTRQQQRAHQKTGAYVLLPKPTSSTQQPIHRRNRSSQTPSANIIYTLHICVCVCTMHKMLSGCVASKVFRGGSSQKVWGLKKKEKKLVLMSLSPVSTGKLIREAVFQTHNYPSNLTSSKILVRFFSPPGHYIK